MTEIFYSLISKALGIPARQVEKTMGLLDEGATIPFISRYRKEVTGELDEEQIRAVEERVQYLRNLIKRQEEILASITEQGKLTPELAAAIEATAKLQELEDLYPKLSPKERENGITKEHGCVFLMKIGDKLGSGKPHDGRAPDYDDWQLNGDILFWFEHLNCALEISSMGIRVDETALSDQLRKAGCEDRKALPYHRMLLNGELPYTIGGGIGQSRLCMLLLDRAHVGEVQASIWPDEMRKECRKNNIFLL